MVSSHLIAIEGAIVSVIILFTSFFILRRVNRKFKNYEKSIGNLISPQRDYVENLVYSNAKPLIQDPGFFSDANHLFIEYDIDNPIRISKKNPDFSFFENMGMSLDEISVNEKIITCLMPFNKRFDKIKKSISDACTQSGYIFRRTDDELIADNNDVRKSIVRMILESSIIIAVLDGRNPNVFYEIGIAHSMGKFVLMVANLNRDEYQQSARKQPVDLLAHRLITYNNPSELHEKLLKSLITIKSIQDNDRREEEKDS